jgi:hypothetical protein
MQGEMALWPSTVRYRVLGELEDYNGRFCGGGLASQRAKERDPYPLVIFDESSSFTFNVIFKH